MVVTIVKTIVGTYVTVFIIVCLLHLIFFIPLLMASGAPRKEGEETPLFLKGPFAITNYLFMYPLEVGGAIYKYAVPSVEPPN